MQDKNYKLNDRLIRVIRKIDEVLRRNSIYDFQEKINKILKFFISIQRDQLCSVSNFSDTKYESNKNSNQSKSKFFFGKKFLKKLNKLLNKIILL